MRILVTGGAGFIGSHLCERLMAEGHDLAILDDLNDFYPLEMKRQNLAEIRLRGEFRFVEGDIRDAGTVGALVGSFGPEVVVHLAARAGVRPSLEDPVLYEQVNVGGTTVLLEAARRAGVRRFVFASSSSIYGIANRVPFSEQDTVNLPISPYAATKLAGEKMCHTFSHLYRLQVACLRFFTVYGPRQRPDLAIRKFIENIDRGLPIPVFGDGSSGRDYTYVDDTVSGVVAAIHHDCRYDIFNLGNSSPVDLNTMIAVIEKSLGRKAVITRLPEQMGDVPITYADISKARQILGYHPQTSFADGIDAFVRWYRKQTVGVRDA